MIKAILFTLLGYFSGSILYAKIFARLFQKENMIEESKDHNPGSATAFMHGGIPCGILTFLCDTLKGFLPVFLYMCYCRHSDCQPIGIGFVLAAPVIGHIFPVLYKFRGGKGITTTFGCLMGLLPLWQPANTLGVFFIFFSVIVRISPHFYRTLFSFFCALVCMACFVDRSGILLGFFIINIAVFTRWLTSKEEKEKLKIRFLWMR